LNESILSDEIKDRIQNTIFKRRPNVIEQEKMFDAIESGHGLSVEITPKQERRVDDIKLSEEHADSIEKDRSPWFNYMDLLKLSSMILRNSELVNEAALKRMIESPRNS
jgi:hypothetical protein